MKLLNNLRIEYTKMPENHLKEVAVKSYAFDSDDVKEMDKKTLIENMIAIEFRNYYK